MPFEVTRSGAALQVRVSGPLDAANGQELGESLGVDGSADVVLDLADCGYLSSAGLRVVLELHKQLSKLRRRLIVTNASDVTYRIFETTGFTRMMDISRRAQKISIDGLELMSSGVCGECYRLDAERVVKLYYEGVDAKIAEQEKCLAREALIMGIPTAISFEVVTCGSRTGVVYEMLNAELLSDAIRNDLGQLEHHAKTLVSIARRIHSAKPSSKDIPSIKPRLVASIEQLRGDLLNADVQMLHDKLASVPDAETCVHFDLHTSNIMIKDGESMIIDLGDFSRGSWLFDLGVLYMIYGVPRLGLCERATQIPAAKGVELWQRIEQQYFADKSPEEWKYFHRNRNFLASLRLIYASTFLPRRRPAYLGMLQETLLPAIRDTV